MVLDVISYQKAKKLSRHARQHLSGGIDPLQLEKLKQPGDDEKIKLGGGPDYSVYYDSTADEYVLYDEINTAKLLRIPKNTPIQDTLKAGGIHELPIADQAPPGDDTKLTFGAGPDYSVYYDSIDDCYYVRDEVNGVDVMKLPKNPADAPIDVAVHQGRHGIGGADEVVGILLQDIANNRPTAGTNNRFYLATDTMELSRDNGTAWERIGVLGGLDLTSHTVRHEAGGADELPLTNLKQPKDNEKITLGAAPDFSIRYDATDDVYYVRDEVNAVDVLKLVKNPAGAPIDLASHATRHKAGGDDLTPLADLPQPADDKKIYLGTNSDYSIRYDSTDNCYYVRDEINNVDVMKLVKNMPLEFDIPFSIIYETHTGNIDATITRKLLTKPIFPMVENYAKKVAIEATWVASKSDSRTKVGIYDYTGRIYICAVEGNEGREEKSVYADLPVGHQIHGAVEITQASSSSGATTRIYKAIMYQKVKIA